jgi:hypothetical protein
MAINKGLGLIVNFLKRVVVGDELAVSGWNCAEYTAREQRKRDHSSGGSQHGCSLLSSEKIPSIYFAVNRPPRF